ncbi:SH3 domain-binding protein 5-like isoform X1 [Tribolium madens]|uniref:SH3 domain-binding protein 5-like isoform X1 n=1 Tax=Tribolium madens TaxID=41895 RepID=UPI001CF730D3|nr:SH3 domain-binding protein 5-like isoform X1 [Tribolium madens]
MCENGAEYTDTVDPRVHVELERLNNATDEINKLEVELDEARHNFRQLLCDSTARVDALRVKLGMCVERAKPYYEARFCANEALKQTQVAAMKFERANSAHSAAREMVYLAEQGLGGRTLDPAWQEMLNHATQRVNDAERERGIAGTEHRIACMKHEASNAKVQSLQKELKRAIAKSSLSIRRSFMTMSNIFAQHELMLLPYYEMKAHFNHLLEQQKSRVQHYESQVAAAKLTYAEALRNLEQISDEIHQTRRKASLLPPPNKQRSQDSNESFLDDAQEFVDEYKSLPQTLGASASPIMSRMDDIEGYKNIRLNGSPGSPIENPSVAQSHSSEWTEINLDSSSPEDDVPYRKLQGEEGEKPRLVRQKTLPNPSIDNEFSSLKNKMKLDTSISNWISRSSAKNEGNSLSSSRRQSLDNILGPTGEKVKEIFSHGMMMLNISSLTERRNSEPKPGLTEEKTRSSAKKIPSPLEKTLTYLTAEEDNSDTESLSSVDMLNEDQISSLMLDKEIGVVCEQVLGTPITEVVSLPQCASSSHPSK